MNNSPEYDARTALVLGGGGSTGNAWLIGVIAGLAEAGLDVAGADLTIGTSAGSTAAGQLAGASPAELLAASVQSVPPSAAGPRRSSADGLRRLTDMIAAAADVSDLRRRLGAAALDRQAVSDGSWQPRWRAIVGSRLPIHDWPKRRVLITAMNARTGDPVTFDRDSGVELVDAVAASCSNGLPYQIGESWYLDGGFRVNAENADLAAGHARVLVLSPFGGRSLHPQEWGTHLAAQVDELRSGGSEVETICPENRTEHLFGVNAMDLSLRPAAARAGYELGLARAGELSAFWR